jgi:ABC-type phosphate transport system substrate-binding protein
MELAIIVNRTAGIGMLTTNELKSIYLGEKTKWPDGKIIASVALAREGSEFRFLLKAVCGMSEADYKRYLIQMSFEGKSVMQPRMMTSPGAVKAFVSTTPGAIGFVPARDVDPSVSIVKINGAAPGDSAYKLSMQR